MFHISIDDGYKEFTINHDPERVIRFNPADLAIVERMESARKAMEEIASVASEITLNADGSPTLESAASTVAELDQKIKEQVDYVFNYPVSDAVFGKQSPLASVKGIPLFEQFMLAAIPYVKSEIQAEMAASEKRVAKYTDGVAT